MRRWQGFDSPPVDKPNPGALTAADRCDGCGAQVQHRAQINGTELLFCAHHWRRCKDRLPQQPAATSGLAGE